MLSRCGDCATDRALPPGASLWTSLQKLDMGKPDGPTPGAPADRSRISAGAADLPTGAFRVRGCVDESRSPPPALPGIAQFFFVCTLHVRRIRLQTAPCPGGGEVGWFPVLPKAPLSRQTIVRFSGASATPPGGRRSRQIRPSEDDDRSRSDGKPGLSGSPGCRSRHVEVQVPVRRVGSLGDADVCNDRLVVENARNHPDCVVAPHHRLAERPPVLERRLAGPWRGRLL